VRDPQDVRRNRLLGALPSADLLLILPHLTDGRLDRGAVLQNVQERIERLWFPLSGMVSLLTPLMDGTSVETVVIGREGAVNAIAGSGPWSASTQAVVQLPGTSVAISASRFEDAIRKSEPLRNIILHYKESLLARVQQKAACNASHQVEQRLARWLLQAHDRVDGNQLHLTQEFLSQMLSVRRTTVTMFTTKLQEAGLIRQQRGMIEIVDRNGLEAAACECYAVLRFYERMALPDQLARGATGGE
jgi:CRP-like cAMP-binding protein